MKRWLAISLLIPRGFGEPVSNFLIEQGATGIEEVNGDSKGEGVRAYFLEAGRRNKVLRGLRRYLKSLKAITPEISQSRIETASIPEQDWGENWKRFFKPIEVTSKILVKPPWSRIRLKKDQISIDINPGMAFGTGTHVTTRVCLKALERSLRKKGLSVLDVGTGSGVLSIAAAKLGAGEIWGLDVDGAAIGNAMENVERNGVADVVKIRKGRIGDVRKRFSVVVANIDQKSLKRMRWPLIRHLKSGGLLVLSGILEGESARFRQHYVGTGHFQWSKVTIEEGWACIVLKKK